MNTNCTECGGTGFALRTIEGFERAMRCSCRTNPDGLERLEYARIPRRYEACSLDTYYPQGSMMQSGAKSLSEQFIEEYPIGIGAAGLLFLGPPGVGKTHLAVAILKALVVEKGAQGLFYDYGDLLRTIQSTWDKSSEVSESQVLDPVIEAELLVLDDLGAARPSQWVQEVLFHILNSRYNGRRTTILTSNHLDAAGGEPGASAGRQRDLREASLEHQIGVRLRSRLYEMCRTVTIEGPDFRRMVNSAEINR